MIAIKFYSDIWQPPFTVEVDAALRAYSHASGRWSVVAPRMTAARAHIKLMAWNSGAKPQPDPPLSAEQQEAARALAAARLALDEAQARAIGPWRLLSA